MTARLARVTASDGFHCFPVGTLVEATEVVDPHFPSDGYYSCTNYHGFMLDSLYVVVRGCKQFVHTKELEFI